MVLKKFDVRAIWRSGLKVRWKSINMYIDSFLGNLSVKVF